MILCIFVTDIFNCWVLFSHVGGIHSFKSCLDLSKLLIILKKKKKRQGTARFCWNLFPKVTNINASVKEGKKIQRKALLKGQNRFPFSCEISVRRMDHKRWTTISLNADSNCSFASRSMKVRVMQHSFDLCTCRRLKGKFINEKSRPRKQNRSGTDWQL